MPDPSGGTGKTLRILWNTTEDPFYL